MTIRRFSNGIEVFEPPEKLKLANAEKTAILINKVINRINKQMLETLNIDSDEIDEQVS